MIEMVKVSNNFVGVFLWGDFNLKLESFLVMDRRVKLFDLFFWFIGYGLKL